MKIEKWLKVTIITLGLLIFLFLSALAGMKYTSRPDFCAYCHIMKPAVKTWSALPHKEVNCLECHADPGPIGYIKRKMGGIGEVYKYMSGNYDGVFETKLNMANCIKCHSSESKFAKAKDITATGVPRAAEFPHQDILKETPSCLECHNDAGHGEELSRGFPLRHNNIE